MNGRAWLMLVLALATCVAVNLVSTPLFQVALGLQANFWVLSFFGCTLGIMAAEMFLLAAYVAFSPQRWLTRIFSGWLVMLVLFAAYAAGTVYTLRLTIVAEAFPELLHNIGVIGISYGVLVATAALSLWWTLRERWFFQLSRISEETPTVRSRIHWSTGDLLVLTALAAGTFALQKFTPVQPLLLDGESLLTLSILIVLVPAIAIATCWLVLNLLIRADRHHTAWRPIHLGLLLTAQLVIVFAATQTRQDIFSTVILSLIAAVNAYATSIVVALMALHVAGWHLRWDFRGGKNVQRNERTTSLAP